MDKYKKNKKILEKSFNYKPEMEHDACGVGLIASTNGKNLEKLLNTALKHLKLFGTEVPSMQMVNPVMEQEFKLR